VNEDKSLIWLERSP